MNIPQKSIAFLRIKRIQSKTTNFYSVKMFPNSHQRVEYNKRMINSIMGCSVVHKIKDEKRTIGKVNRRCTRKKKEQRQRIE